MSLTVADLAKRMRDIDTCLLCTHSPQGLNTRPMSNNRDVEWDGSSWFFAMEDTGAAEEIRADQAAMVTYTGEKGLWIAVRGDAYLHADKELMKEHWDPDVERWFEDGVDTVGLRLIEVRATSIRYWTYEDGDGEITL